MQVSQTYSQPSTAKTDAQGMHFDFSAECSRPPVSIHAMIKNSLSYARLMLALRKVVKGDWRSAQPDHSAYQAWVRERYLEELPNYAAETLEKQTALVNKKNDLQAKLKTITNSSVTIRKKINTARRAYYNWLYANDRDKWMVLDPVISVHEDSVIFEAFSLDESSYGRVSVPMEQLEIFDDIKYGTTNIDFSQALADEIYRVRSYRAAWLKVAFAEVSLSTSAGGTVEKKIDLPESWVRGFLQVQSAATLAGTDITLSANTLAEILGVLKRQKAKASPRSLRFYLKKGEKPRIVIDPWGIEILENKYVYQPENQEDTDEKEIRIWGRRRLAVLEDILPYAEKVQLKLLGTGMPSYWSVSLDGHRFDIGLSGWTANDWSAKANFDLLASTQTTDNVDITLVEKKLIEKLKGTPADFAKWLGIERNEATFALQELCKSGQAMYDHLTGIYRWRQLLQQDVKLSEVPEDERMKYAIQLINDDKVKVIDKQEDKNLKIIKTIVEGKNTFKPVLHIDQDGRVQKAVCTCSFFRKNKLRQGPCAHIIASTLVINK